MICFLTLTDLWRTVAPEWPENLLPAIREHNQQANRTTVVLDDDPTGTQTVYDVPVLTDWEEETLRKEFVRKTPIFYISTNSRSLPEAETVVLHELLAGRLEHISRQTGRSYHLVSRSDSTLRGHFPAEPAALERGWGAEATWLLIPFFAEGGRVTAHNIHYIAENNWLTPVGESPFAKDATFGYRSSNLKEWVEEKTNGSIQEEQVGNVWIDIIRKEGVDGVRAHLEKLAANKVIIINALSLRDLEVVVRAIQQMSERRFIFRTAASFVQVLAGLETRPLLGPGELSLPSNGVGGLTVVGSYVPKTTAQLEVLVNESDALAIEFSVPALFDEPAADAHINNVVKRTEAGLLDGRDVVVYTSRTLVQTDDPAESLRLVNRVSEGLVELVRRLAVRPRYLLAKGGITASDLAVKGLGVRRAVVRGQILPGVPVWQTGDETRFPGLTYVVFPGNVGGEGALREAVAKMK